MQLLPILIIPHARHSSLASPRFAAALFLMQILLCTIIALTVSGLTLNSELPVLPAPGMGAPLQPGRLLAGPVNTSCLFFN